MKAHRELATLVRDTRLYLQTLVKGKVEPLVKGKAELLVKGKVEPVVKGESAVEKPAPKEAPKVVVKAERAPQPLLPNPKWELHPMEQATLPVGLQGRIASSTQVSDPPLDLCLVLPEENSHHRLFLENVARAVTRSFASSVVVLYQETLFKKPISRFLLLPADLLQKKFPKARPHHPIVDGGVTWIPLEPLDLYALDINAKRALWMAIQRLFQS